MAKVEVTQRDAHLASSVRIEYVEVPGGRKAKATLTAITNVRWGSGESRREEATVVQWTAWGPLGEDAATYLGQGSHVNIVGRLRNNKFEKDGETEYRQEHVAEEIDYLDTKAQAEARRSANEAAAQQSSRQQRGKS